MIKLTSTKIWTNDLAQFDDSLFYCAEAIVTDVKGIEGTEFPAQCRFQTAAYFGKGNAGHKPIACYIAMANSAKFTQRIIVFLLSSSLVSPSQEGATWICSGNPMRSTMASLEAN